MNILKPAKVRELCRMFAYGTGVRDTARASGVNRGTVAKYRREWARWRPECQRAYDLLWDGDGEGWDRIMVFVPDPIALATGDAWQDDQDDDGLRKSVFYERA